MRKDELTSRMFQDIIHKALLVERAQITEGIARLAIEIRAGKFPPSDTEPSLEQIFEGASQDQQDALFAVIGTFTRDFIELLKEKPLPEIIAVEQQPGKDCETCGAAAMCPDAMPAGKDGKPTCH